MKKMFLLLMMSVVTIAASAYDFMVDGIYYNVISFGDRTVGIASPGIGEAKYAGDFIIPETVNFADMEMTVSAICDGAFGGCELTSITIPSTVTTFGYKAFAGCTLTSIVIPDAVTQIDEFCFTHCKQLRKVVLPKYLQVIPTYMFENCTNLEEVEIPEGLNTINGYAFWCCESIKSINLPEGLRSIGAYAFYQTSLSEVSIPASVYYIHRGAFRGLKRDFCMTIEDGPEALSVGFEENGKVADNFESLYVGRKLIRHTGYFNDRPFAPAKNLAFGKYVEDLGNFFNFSATESIQLYGSVPPQAEPFTTSQYMNIRLTIPEGTTEIYNAAEPWRNFLHREIASGIELPTASLDSPSAIYDLQGRQHKSFQKGVNIVGGKKIMVK